MYHLGFMHIPAGTVYKLGEVVHTCISRSREAEAGEWRVRYSLGFSLTQSKQTNKPGKGVGDVISLVSECLPSIHEALGLSSRAA